MIQEIYIIDNTHETYQILNRIFKNDKDIEIKSIKVNELGEALKNIPGLFIINEEGIEESVKEVCKTIRHNEDNSITPIMVISNNFEKSHRVNILKTEVEYYIVKPIDDEYFYYTIKNIIRLIYINRRISPLTGLPGNVQIDAEIKKRLRRNEKFAILYFDLDYFKGYNDIYGFVKGDEIIKYTGNLIIEVITRYGKRNCFVGHIGGDDFVAITNFDDCEKICQDIIIQFDKDIKNFYNREDVIRGYISIENRRGEMEQSPIISISIGVVTNANRKFDSVLQIGEVSAQVKHAAKMVMGSSYVIDRRK